MRCLASDASARGPPGDSCTCAYLGGDRAYVLREFRQAFQSGQERLQYQAGDCLSETEQATPTLPLADTAFFLCLCNHLALSCSPGRFFTSTSLELMDRQADSREAPQASSTSEAPAERKKDPCAQVHIDVMVSCCWPCSILLVISRMMIVDTTHASRRLGSAFCSICHGVL